MFRKDIMPGLLLRILLRVSLYSWVGGGVIYEALAAGKPLLMFSDQHDHTGRSTDLFSIYNAKSPDQVASNLQNYVRNPTKGKQLGKNGAHWYEETVVKKSVDHYTAYFERKASQLKISLY